MKSFIYLSLHRLEALEARLPLGLPDVARVHLRSKAQTAEGLLRGIRSGRHVDEPARVRNGVSGAEGANHTRGERIYP
eukprot:5837789-Pyramimonas_sp.AAC.1